MAKLLSALSVVMLSLAITAPTQAAPPAGDGPEAKPGCCSHHGGVCGRSGHTTMCCDGGASPTCQCRAADGEP